MTNSASRLKVRGLEVEAVKEPARRVVLPRSTGTVEVSRVPQRPEPDTQDLQPAKTPKLLPRGAYERNLAQTNRMHALHVVTAQDFQNAAQDLTLQPLRNKVSFFDVDAVFPGRDTSQTFNIDFRVSRPYLSPGPGNTWLVGGINGHRTVYTDELFDQEECVFAEDIDFRNHCFESLLIVRSQQSQVNVTSSLVNFTNRNRHMQDFLCAKVFFTDTIVPIDDHTYTAENGGSVTLTHSAGMRADGSANNMFSGSIVQPGETAIFRFWHAEYFQGSERIETSHFTRIS